MPEKKKNYLLIPSVPTPNGRLHLGHIGGPFLTVDILARYLRMCGHSAVIISGTDSYESYAAGKAAEENSAPEEICNYYHNLIAEDLKSMNIQVDQFVNPLAAQWRDSYQEWHESLFQQLLNNGVTQTLKEYIPWDEHNKRYLTGYWLEGNCPICQEKTSSYFCESCGAHFRPEEIIQESKVEQREVENIFLKLPNPIELGSKGVNKTIETSFHQYLELQNNLFRLTTHCDWGLSDNTDNTHTRTLFSYGFIFTYFLMLGEIAGELLGINTNAFAKNSAVTTVSSFGIDNSLPFLSSAIGTSAGCPQYKPFDYYLGNYFYYLDGDKFSTSRQHMIGVDDVINNKKLSSDIIRLYLASIDIRNQTGNFVCHDFVNYYNSTIDWIEQFIVQGLQNLPDVITDTCDNHLKQQLDNLFAIQQHALQPANFLPHIAVKSINDWLAQAMQLNPGSTDYFWWLKGFTLTIYPYMPQLGKAIWAALGYGKLPSMCDFNSTPALPLHKKIQINLGRINQGLEIIRGGNQL